MKVRTEARREAILEIARKVFLDCGFERASMSEIARQVGGSKATLYGYFASKEELFVAVALPEGRTLMEGTLANVEQQALADGLRDALQRLSVALVAFLASAQTIAAIRMVLAEAGRSDIGQMFYAQGPHQGITRTASLLSAAMARGELRAADPMTAAMHFHGLLTAEVMPLWYQREPASLTPEQSATMAERAMDVFLQGYAAI